MIFNILILGNGSAIPKRGSYPHSQVLFHDTNKVYLLDCGEGTQIRLLENKVRMNKLTKIFITHLHGDHFFGLIGLLSSMALLQRQKKLDIYAPAGLKEFIQVTFKLSGTVIPYELNIYEIDTTKYSLITTDNNLEVYSIPLKHSIPCCGFLFKEIKKINLDKNKIELYNLKPSLIKKLQNDESIAINSKIIKSSFFQKVRSKPARSYAYITDTLYSEEILPLIRGVNLLYHETTYTEKFISKALSTYHSTAKQAATIAKKANVKTLIIGHISNRYLSPSEPLEEALKVFENTQYGQQYKLFEIY